MSAAPSPRNNRSRLAVSSPYIHVEPDFLVYPPPHYGRCVQNVLTIYNTSTRPCVWKLKSQHPQRYIAKPNAAVIAPRSATRVRVTLRDGPMLSPDTNTPMNIPADTQDRFRLTVKFATPEQLQSVRVPPSDSPTNRRTEQSNPLEVDSDDDERNESGGSGNPNGKTARAKMLFNSIEAPVDHEKDIIAYFKPGMETPVGGEVHFLSSSYSRANQRPPPDTTPTKTERSMSALQDTPYASPVKDIERRLQQEAQQQDKPKSRLAGLAGRVLRKLRRMALIALLVFALAYAIGVYARLRVAPGAGEADDEREASTAEEQNRSTRTTAPDAAPEDTIIHTHDAARKAASGGASEAPSDGESAHE